MAEETLAICSFACCIQFMIFSKNKYWQMLHRQNVNRGKKLELWITELNQTVRSN